MAQEPDIDLGAVTEALNNKTDTDVQNTTNVGSAQIAHFAAPSSHFDNLTLKASGSTYTAPADGWFCLRKLATASMQFAAIILHPGVSTEVEIASYPPGADYTASIMMPAAKGDQVQITYNVAGTLISFRFLYAKGCEPQS